LRVNLLVPIVIFFLNWSFVRTQTLIINEVSNGPSGNKEYVELLVISDTITYNCTQTTPPCLDIRGWIFDDNSGYHGGMTGTGVAPGAVRFSNNALWACVPVGTLIILYNDQDPNVAIPTNDLSLNDGNCRLVVPINNLQLLESNSLTPGAVACSYPPANWTAGGNWNNTVLANSGDCARIVDLAGCEVFSVCYGTANTNNQIYFSGSGSATVYFFNGTNPVQQANWTSGCTNAATCGSNQQTPGLPNNLANAAFIAQFNNACLPITPLQLSVQTTPATGCTCTGTAVANATGSIPGYTYEWINSAGVSIGTSGTLTGLCAGNYSCVATSSIGCTDTSNFVISLTSMNLTEPIFNTIGPICQGTTFTLPAISSNGITGTWLPALTNTQTQNYVFTPAVGQCADSTNMTIVVNPLTVPSFPTSDTICSGENYLLALVSANGIPGTWTPVLSLNQTQTYTFTPISSSVCVDTTQFTLVVQPLPVAQIQTNSSPNGLIPLNVQFTAQNATPTTTYAWQCSNGFQASGANANTILTQPGCIDVYLTAINGNCAAYDTAFVYACAQAVVDTTDTSEVLPAPFVFYVPNAFTPDADQFNQHFEVVWSGTLPKSFELTIYNRWGECVFWSNDPSAYWDGTSTQDGHLAPDGLYVWKLALSYSKNEEAQVFSGHLNLLR
jgi:gliding motility-associated-like protein